MKNSRIIAVAVGTMAAGAIITLAVLNPHNYAETSEDGGINNLYTRRYDTPFENRTAAAAGEKPRVIREIERIIAGQKTYGRFWKMIDTKLENDSAIIKAEVPVVIFTDDLEVQISFAPRKSFNSSSGKVVINIRSVSRCGSTDFGENRRHIQQLLEHFDFTFGSEKL